ERGAPGHDPGPPAREDRRQARPGHAVHRRGHGPGAGGRAGLRAVGVAFFDQPWRRLHYRIDGDRGPWLTFCNSLGTDLHMWDAQARALSGSFRVLRYDRRGHGATPAPPAPYSLADLGGDVLELLDGLGIERTHFCGLSIGDLVGQWLGVHAGDRLDKLVVCATAAKIGTAKGWRERE